MRVLNLAAMLAGTMFAADPALTIYNQNFAVIRDTVPLDLHKGENMSLTAKLLRMWNRSP